MPTSPESESFIYAALYASLLLQVVEHLFPGRTLFELSADQRRIAGMETDHLLLQARWRVESESFTRHFTALLAEGADSRPQSSDTKNAPTGQYV